MTRRDYGLPPSDDFDVITKKFMEDAITAVEAELETEIDAKYSKPTDGIPGTDIADHTVGVSNLNLTGSPSPITFACGNGTWSKLIGNNLLVEPSTDYTLSPPVGPIDGELVMVEVRPTADILVTIPGSIKLTTGMRGSLNVSTGKSLFIGLRWSDTANSWYVLATSLEL